MTYLVRGAVGALALWVLLTPAGAQENLDQGKTAAQLFASDCAICHKSVNGLGKSGGAFGLDSFLRVHYTASRESADKLAKYLQAFANAPEPSASKGKRAARGSDKEKKEKKGEAKASEPNSSKEKSAKDEKKKDGKPSEAKAEPKAEPKPEAKSEPKKSEPEPKTEAKSEPKSEPKPEAKPESKSEPKADSKQDKSD